jgi:hypothetical protein
MKEIEVLSEYGAVRTCKIINEQVVTIVLTDGFSENAITALSFLADCQELFPDYPKMETCVIELNCAIVVLTK